MLNAPSDVKSALVGALTLSAASTALIVFIGRLTSVAISAAVNVNPGSKDRNDGLFSFNSGSVFRILSFCIAEMP